MLTEFRFLEMIDCPVLGVVQHEPLLFLHKTKAAIFSLRLPWLFWQSTAMSENFNKTGFEILGMNAPRSEYRRDAIQAMRKTDRPPVLRKIKRAIYALCSDGATTHALPVAKSIKEDHPSESDSSSRERDTRTFTANLGIAQLTVSVTHDD